MLFIGAFRISRTTEVPEYAQLMLLVPIFLVPA